MEGLLRLSPEELTGVLDKAFPAEARARLGEVASVAPGHVRMRLAPTAAMLRPGEIVSGPSLVGLIDVAAYAVVLAHIGAVEMAVTSTMSVSFLRPCRPEMVVADARLLKLGKRRATIDVRLWQDSEERVVTQATLGYAIPA